MGGLPTSAPKTDSTVTSGRAAAMEIALPDRAASTLTLRTDLVSASKIAAGMPRDGAAPVPDDDAALAAVAHLLDAVAGRLAHTDAAAGDTATRPAPSCQLTGAGDLSADVMGEGFSHGCS